MLTINKLGVYTLDDNTSRDLRSILDKYFTTRKEKSFILTLPRWM